MIPCPACGARVPEVLGVPEQRCPTCGAWFSTAGPPAAAPPEPVHESRPVEDAAPRDAAGAVAAGARIYARNLPRFALFWAPVAALDLALALAVLAWSRSSGVALDAAPRDMSTAARLLGALLPALFLVWVAKLAWWGAHAVLVRDAKEGRADVRAAFRVAWNRRGALAATAAALAVLYAAGALVLLVPLLVLLHAYLFAPAAAAFGARGVAAALGESRALARERRTIGFMLVVALAIVVAFLLAEGARGLAEALGAGAGTAEVARAVVAWLLAPFAPTLVATMWLAAQTRAPAAAAVVERAPEAAAASTKCPACGNVFAYARPASGSAATVVCPRCGKAGVVRSS